MKLTKDNIEFIIGALAIISVCLLAPKIVEMAIKTGILIGDKL